MAALLVLTMLAAVAPRPAQAATTGWVDTDVLNLRTDPATWGEVITQMWYGEAVTVLDGPTGDGWYYVDYVGLVGWAFGGYLSINGSAGWSGGDAGLGGYVGYDAGVAWVGTDALNVRSDASTDSVVIDTLVQGQELWLAGNPVGAFTPIWYGGGVAWVATKYIAWEPVGSGGASLEHWIDVDRSRSRVTLMIGDEAIASYKASLGWDTSRDGFYATAVGTYYVYNMREDLHWTDYGQAYITHWVGFDPVRINGFHSWSLNKRGRVISGGDGPTGGCVATHPDVAAEIYRFAFIGMRVEVHQ